MVEQSEGKRAEELPIDVLASVLLEWLTTRKKVPADWSKRVAAIQAKAKESIKDVPAEVLQKARGGADGPLDYFRAMDIRNALAASSERSLFGGLTGNAAVWDKIIKAYEKGALYLGECAMAMIHNADFEIPYLRRQAARLNQQITDADRKQAEYVRNSQTCANAFQQECKKVGISGKGNIRHELHALTSQVPQLCAAVVVAASADPVGEAMQHYRDFSRYAHATPDAEPMLPVLLEVREGRTAPPASTAHTARAAGAEAGAHTHGAGTAAENGGGVNWDIGGEGSGAEGGGISWDNGGGDDGGGGGGEGISWDIDVGVGEAGQQGGCESGGRAFRGILGWTRGVKERVGSWVGRVCKKHSIGALEWRMWGRSGSEREGGCARGWGWC